MQASGPLNALPVSFTPCSLCTDALAFSCCSRKILKLSAFSWDLCFPNFTETVRGVGEWGREGKYAELPDNQGQTSVQRNAVAMVYLVASLVFWRG